MKRFKRGLSTVLIASLCITTLSGFKQVDSTNTNIQNNTKVEKILWEYGTELPPQKGYQKNIGTAGILYGRINNYLIVGGGANFPEKSVLEGGAKKTYKDIYLLKEDEKGNLQVVDHQQLPFEIGYGSSVTTYDGVYYIGGSTSKENADDITLFTQEGGKIKYEKVGDLPFTLSDGIAVEDNNILYVGFGKQDGKASNRFISYNLDNNFVKELNTLNDGSIRNQAVAQILNHNIYLFSGGGDIIEADGYKYIIEQNKWEKVANVSIDGVNDISLYGASSVKLNEDEMLVIGGFDKTVYDNAVKNLNILKDEELKKFREIYFGLEPYQYNWNKQILIYNSKENSWRSIGKVPFDAPCGAGLIKNGNNLYLVNGEIKPGVRTNSIYIGRIVNNN